MEVSPTGSASARRNHRCEWDDAGGRMWIVAGCADSCPLLSVVQQAYSFGKASVKFGAGKQLVSRNEAL